MELGGERPESGEGLCQSVKEGMWLREIYQ